MKKWFLFGLIWGFHTMIYAQCDAVPVGMELAKSIEAKEVKKAKKLLSAYKDDIKAYLKKCDQSKEKFEETSVMIHTYEARLADVEYDLNQKAHTTDCSKVPNSSSLELAFKNKDAAAIQSGYERYKKDAAEYIDNCASHAEYEVVYESAMIYDEMYEEWKKQSAS